MRKHSKRLAERTIFKVEDKEYEYFQDRFMGIYLSFPQSLLEPRHQYSDL